jgi:hypothetical protein
VSFVGHGQYASAPVVLNGDGDGIARGGASNSKIGEIRSEVEAAEKKRGGLKLLPCAVPCVSAPFLFLIFPILLLKSSSHVAVGSSSA